MRKDKKIKMVISTTPRCVRPSVRPSVHPLAFKRNRLKRLFQLARRILLPAGGCFFFQRHDSKIDLFHSRLLFLPSFSPHPLSGLPGLFGARGDPGVPGVMGGLGKPGPLGAAGLDGTDGLEGQPGRRGVKGMPADPPLPYGFTFAK